MSEAKTNEQMTLERALFNFHARDFWQTRTLNRPTPISWEDRVKELVVLYDKCGWWHLIPESALADRQAWRDGTAKARFRFEPEETWFEDEKLIWKDGKQVT